MPYEAECRYVQFGLATGRSLLVNPTLAFEQARMQKIILCLQYLIAVVHRKKFINA